MLEICPSIASDRPTAEIHPLSIGGKADPVRLVFTASQGPAVDLQRPRLGREPAESTLPKSYWRWTELLENNERGFFPYTPATNLLYGLREALRMLHEEGLPQVFARHARLAEATRRAVGDVGARDDAARPGGIQHVLTAVQMPDGFDERDLRKLVLERFNLSLGAGLGKLAGRAFRIGRLGDFNELMLEGTLSGVEMGLALSGIPHNGGGVTAALRYQTEQAPAYGSA